VFDQGKLVKLQWCELVESEEPKAQVDDSLPEEQKQEFYVELGKKRSLAMIEKANNLAPEDITFTAENWDKLPSTLKYKLQNVMLGIKSEDFLAG
jgi:hypothetical protein